MLLGGVLTKKTTDAQSGASDSHHVLTPIQGNAHTKDNADRK